MCKDSASQTVLVLRTTRNSRFRLDSEMLLLSSGICRPCQFEHQETPTVNVVLTVEKEKDPLFYRSWPWISNCWEWDSNSRLSGIEPRALTTRPRRLGANLRRDATSCLLFLNQSVLADFDEKKLPDLRLVAFQARVKRRICHCRYLKPFTPKLKTYILSTL